MKGFWSLSAPVGELADAQEQAADRGKEWEEREDASAVS